MSAPPPTIAPMRPEDMPACLRVIADAWSPLVAQQAQDDLRDMFLKPRFAPVYYVARVEDRIVGTAGYITSWLNWGVFDLIYVAVHEVFRRRGIGGALVSHCLTDIDVYDGATVLTTYRPGFYLPFGFETMDADFRCAGKSNALMTRRARSQREARP